LEGDQFQFLIGRLVTNSGSNCGRKRICFNSL
jgi:hypothetical protein